jgi:hypothetical protein
MWIYKTGLLTSFISAVACEAAVGERSSLKPIVASHNQTRAHGRVSCPFNAKRGTAACFGKCKRLIFQELHSGTFSEQIGRERENCGTESEQIGNKKGEKPVARAPRPCSFSEKTWAGHPCHEDTPQPSFAKMMTSFIARIAEVYSSR